MTLNKNKYYNRFCFFFKFSFYSCFVSVQSSDLAIFTSLTTLEIRGSGLDQNLVFLIDAPLPLIKNANFEALKLVADEKLKNLHVQSQHPSETYEYVPESEREIYNMSANINNEIEIVPYEVYRMELERSKRPTFIGWNQLEILRIHYCHFDQIYWEMFDGLSNLQHLSLEDNSIKIIPPFAFFGAMSIKTLSLAHNNILELHYRALAGLLELEYLNLSYNNITKLSEITFPPFPNLKIADFQHNTIQYIFPMTFGIMNTTKELILGTDDPSTFDLSFSSGAFLALDQLEFLNLQNVFISQLHQKIFSGLKNVERLHINGSIGTLEFDAFSEMPKIRELKLSDCGLDEISMDAFVGIHNLRIIDLSNNKLTSLPIGLFDDQKNLKEIYLQNNFLANLPAGFFNHPSLQLVRLIENPFKCNCDMSEWKQSITNAIRGKRMTDQSYKDCYSNTKNIALCDDIDEEDDFPKWNYDVDNHLSPRCNGGIKNIPHQTVFYAVRRNLKCLKPQSKDKMKMTTYQMEKQIQKKKSSRNVSFHKMNELIKLMDYQENENERELNFLPIDSKHKTERKITFDEKVRRTYQLQQKELRWQTNVENSNYGEF